MLDRRLSFFLPEFMRMKYFCAWLATCRMHQVCECQVSFRQLVAHHPLESDGPSICVREPVLAAMWSAGQLYILVHSVSPISMRSEGGSPASACA